MGSVAGRCSLLLNRAGLIGGIFFIAINGTFDTRFIACHALSPVGNYLNINNPHRAHLHKAQISKDGLHTASKSILPHRQIMLLHSTSQSKFASTETEIYSDTETEEKEQVFLTTKEDFVEDFLEKESPSFDSQRHLLEDIYYDCNDSGKGDLCEKIEGRDIVASDTSKFDPLLVRSVAPYEMQSRSAQTNSPIDILNEPPMTTSKKESEEKKIFGLSELWFSRILLLCASALYGTNFTVVKILDEHIPIGAAAMLRFTLAAAITSPWIFSKSGSSKTDLQNIETQEGFVSESSLSIALVGMEVGMWNCLGYIAQAYGLETIDASKSAFICSLAVVVVPILNAFQGKPMTTRSFTSAAMAVAGVAFLELGDCVLTGSGHFGIGDIASLLQPVAFGIGFWRLEHALVKFPSEASRLTAWQLLAVAMISSTYCLLGLSGTEPPSVNDVVSWLSDPTILSAVAWTGCVTTALTIYMETRAFKTLSATEATLVLSTEPIFGAAFAGAVVGERFGVSAYTGAVLIILGCVLGGLDENVSESNIDEIKDDTNNETGTCLVENREGTCLVSDALE